MIAQVCLTVSESKRLIARGVAALEAVRARMRQGIIVVSSGSTNAYIVEELLGERFDKRSYVTGQITSAGFGVGAATRPDVVLRDGAPAPDLDRFSALKAMQAGDIFLKGANALNYERGVAGIWVGGEGSGTIGGTLGHIVQKRLHLLVPVGLEKCVPYAIEAAAATIAEEDETLGKVVSLFPVHGHIFTEIEALSALAGVEAIPCSAGGIMGAEGGVTLLLRGEREAVRAAVGIVDEIKGEPLF
ncbi:MAG TPA: hypothetical protein PLJ35_03215 [Anaerolineae bacterium]|nr:hypothetical protein [Anaerolineae bacterium]HOQ97812.1 hypothetical protein [Anaerolineae bacterium]HPL29558.1 hypothetical protein [Anaerolineae bacterium]